MNNKCAGHAQHLCGPEDEEMPIEIAGVFASEPTCSGIRLRGLTEQERRTPGNKLPLLLDIFYVGTHTEQYMGTGKSEKEGWEFSFNGPRGHFSGYARSDNEMVQKICKAARGQGADIDTSLQYQEE
jgi:hypothetical protein